MGICRQTKWEGFMTIRAIIGTVAVLAGLAVLERSVDASTGQAGTCKPTQAYALLHRGETIVVRAQPTPEGTAPKAASAPSGGPARAPRAASARWPCS